MATPNTLTEWKEYGLRLKESGARARKAAGEEMLASILVAETAGVAGLAAFLRYEKPGLERKEWVDGVDNSVAVGGAALAVAMTRTLGREASNHMRAIATGFLAEAAVRKGTEMAQKPKT